MRKIHKQSIIWLAAIRKWHYSNWAHIWSNHFGKLRCKQGNECVGVFPSPIQCDKIHTHTHGTIHRQICWSLTDDSCHVIQMFAFLSPLHWFSFVKKKIQYGFRFDDYNSNKCYPHLCEGIQCDQFLRCDDGEDEKKTSVRGLVITFESQTWDHLENYCWK